MNLAKSKYAIGLMTGTSLDGLDIALCKIKNFGKETEIELIDYQCLDIDVNLKDKIKDACSLEKSNSRLICSLDFELGYWYFKGVEYICNKNGLKYDEIDFVASHGQTIYHLPNPNDNEFASTLQIGQSSIISYNTGIKVVSNFRVMDMAAKGQGAPLVAYSDFILFGKYQKNIALQNIGGIGNVTYLKKNAELEDVIAFDTGVGNMMIDEAMQQLYGLAYDKNGDIAKSGKIITSLQAELKDHPYLKKPLPKTTGREEFGKEFTLSILERYKKYNKEDIICTLTDFCAYSIAKSYQDFLGQIDMVVVSGGGAYNQCLLKMLGEYLKGVEIKTQEDLGFKSDAKEAIAFVILGNETLNNQTSNVPSATRAERKVILGMITPGIKR